MQCVFIPKQNAFVQEKAYDIKQNGKNQKFIPFPDYSQVYFS